MPLHCRNKIDQLQGEPLRLCLIPCSNLARWSLSNGRFCLRDYLCQQNAKRVNVRGGLVPTMLNMDKAEASLLSEPYSLRCLHIWCVLLSEIVSGSKTYRLPKFHLTQLVMELNASSEILHEVYRRLGSCYDRGETRLALTVR